MQSMQLTKYHDKYKRILHDWISQSSRAGFKVLDVGCRRGVDLEKSLLNNNLQNIFGIDLEYEVLKIALEKLKNIQKSDCLVQASGENLPFKDASFDLVYSSEVIEHIDQVDRFIEELKRILKQGGLFIVTTPSRYNYTHLVGKLLPRALKNYLRKYVWYLNPGKEENPHVREYLSKELKEMFKNHGFVVERIKGGILRVPIWPLFNRFSFLVWFWKCLDRIIDMVPGGINIKHNFIMQVRKI